MLQLLITFSKTDQEGPTPMTPGGHGYHDGFSSVQPWQHHNVLIDGQAPTSLHFMINRWSCEVILNESAFKFSTFISTSSSPPSSLHSSLSVIWTSWQEPTAGHLLISGGQGPITQLIFVFTACFWGIGRSGVGPWRMPADILSILS